MKKTKQLVVTLALVLCILVAADRAFQWWGVQRVAESVASGRPQGGAAWSSKVRAEQEAELAAMRRQMVPADVKWTGPPVVSVRPLMPWGFLTSTYEVRMRDPAREGSGYQALLTVRRTGIAGWRIWRYTTLKSTR